MTSPKTTPSAKGTAVVTGASAGIGNTYAKRLAARGYDLLALVARRAATASRRWPGRCGWTTACTSRCPRPTWPTPPTSSASRSAWSATTSRCWSTTPGVSTFGAGRRGTEVAALDAMTDVNVTALVRLSRAAVAAFKQRNRGTLVNIGSVLGFHALPHSGAYSGTKGYVLNFTRGLQQELAGTNVYVQLVLPAATATDIWDLGGRPLATLDPAKVMSTADLVDAALAGLDQGEKITLPSVEDAQLFVDYDTARMKLLAASQTSRPASRYRVSR